jgi:uncharacterized membrane protein YhiD involved in acid resistance
MDEHYLDLAQRAVAALETMADPGMSAGDWVALGVGLSQCLLIAWGLWMINKSNASRDAQNALQQQRHAETMTVQQRRHEESMTVQQQRHEESMALQQQYHEESMTAQQQRHEETIMALKELIRRTAGKDA